MKAKDRRLAELKTLIPEVSPEEDLAQHRQGAVLLGVRALFAAEALKQLGYQDVKSVAGGFNRWKNNGLPFEMPRVLDDDARERYARHLLLPEVGEQGQLKLMDSKVLLIGAGGLGSPAALY